MRTAEGGKLGYIRATVSDCSGIEKAISGGDSEYDWAEA